ncbi:MAG TPA: hypothetical protein VN924_00065 [Bryobacteraceae bacterium]|nr:hypothetical protein [Bryobacteraceae bacterium]
MNTNFRLVCSIVAVAVTAASARAGVVPVDFSSLANEPWTYLPPACNGTTGINNGYTFPTGSQNFGGVPFSIPTGPNNYWNGAAAANCGSGTVSLTIPVGVSGVTSAFTLLNTMWGQFGPQAYLFVTFNGSNGATYTYPLVGGVNVRNFNIFPGGNPVTIDNTSTIQAWTNGMDQTLDRQEYILPAAFASQALTSVTITDTGNVNFSRAVFAGLTVSTCRAYVTETIATSSSKIVYDASKSIYVQEVTLTNTGTAAVTGPLFFILENLPAGVTLVNKSGATACFAPIGSRYVVAFPEGSSLAPNTTVIVKLGFSDPSGAAISYTPLVAGSLGGTP